MISHPTARFRQAAFPVFGRMSGHGFPFMERRLFYAPFSRRPVTRLRPKDLER